MQQHLILKQSFQQYFFSQNTQKRSIPPNCKYFNPPLILWLGFMLQIETVVKKMQKLQLTVKCCTPVHHIPFLKCASVSVIVYINFHTHFFVMMDDAFREMCSLPNLTLLLPFGLKSNIFAICVSNIFLPTLQSSLMILT